MTQIDNTLTERHHVRSMDNDEVMQHDMDWLYGRIYCRLDEADELLLSLVAPCMRTLLARGLINKFFFIRYFEGGFHLRVRFCGQKADLLGPVRDELNEWLDAYFLQRGIALSGPLDWGPSGMDDQTWQSRHAQDAMGSTFSRPVPSYEYDRYEPEIERYGGPQGVQISEQHFMHCSKATLRVLEHECSGAGSRRNATLLLLHGLAEAFQLTDQEKASIFELQARYWMTSSWFTPQLRDLLVQEYERHCLALHRLLSSGQSEPQHKSRAFWSELIDEWSEASKDTYHALTILGQRKQLTQTLSELLLSYIHMLCNRMGFFPREEAYFTYLLYRNYKAHSEIDLSRSA